jgi:hypothetical protein
MMNARAHPGALSQKNETRFPSSSKIRATGLATAQEVCREAVVVVKALKMPATRSRCSFLLAVRSGAKARKNLFWPLFFVAIFFLVLFFLRA